MQKRILNITVSTSKLKQGQTGKLFRC